MTSNRMSLKLPVEQERVHTRVLYYTPVLVLETYHKLQDFVLLNQAFTFTADTALKRSVGIGLAM